jgi:hypothetical protein
MLPLSFQKNNVLSEISVYVRNNLFYQQVMHPYVPLQLPFLPAHKENSTKHPNIHIDADSQ